MADWIDKFTAHLVEVDKITAQPIASDLRVRFTLKRAPDYSLVNLGKVQVFNLSPKSRAVLERACAGKRWVKGGGQ